MYVCPCPTHSLTFFNHSLFSLSFAQLSSLFPMFHLFLYECMCESAYRCPFISPFLYVTMNGPMCIVGLYPCLQHSFTLFLFFQSSPRYFPPSIACLSPSLSPTPFLPTFPTRLASRHKRKRFLLGAHPSPVIPEGRHSRHAGVAHGTASFPETFAASRAQTTPSYKHSNTYTKI